MPHTRGGILREGVERGLADYRQSTGNCQRQLSGSLQAVVMQSSNSRQAVIRQSSGSHQTVIRQSSNSHQKVNRQLPDSYQLLELNQIGISSFSSSSIVGPFILPLYF